MPVTARIGCVVMASGMSRRYGKDKLLEVLGDREVVLHTAGHLAEAGFAPLAVTRSREVAALLARWGIRCVTHDGARKSDTIHVGIESLPADAAGYLFMPADQPLVSPASLAAMAERFERCPSRAVRLGYGDVAGSPVLFPASFRDALLAYAGDRGGLEVLKAQSAVCDIVQAAHEWELWDVDTPEKMERVRSAYDVLVRTSAPGVCRALDNLQ